MSDVSTHFPPQTYSSYFNLNVLVEEEKPSVEPKKQNVLTEEDSSPMLDCFISTMTCIQSILITLLSYATIITAVDQPEQCILEDFPIIRNFATLIEYQSNKITFNSHEKGFSGNYVAFGFLSIDRIPRNAFISYTSHYIIKVDLSFKEIKVIDNEAFTTLFCLHYLDLTGNKLTNLTRGMFQDLENLRTLNLSQNLIDNIPSFVFSNLRSIQMLNITKNNIKNIEKFGLHNITTMERLLMADNKLRHLPSYSFEESKELRELDLSSNKLAYINVITFRGLESLELLNLAGNELVVLNTSETQFMFNHMKSLNLSDNYLLKVDVRGLRRHFPNPNLKIDINFNQFYCADLEVVIHNFNENKVLVANGKSPNALHSIENIVCDGLNATEAVWGDSDSVVVPNSTPLHTSTKNDSGYLEETIEDHSRNSVRFMIVLACIVSVLCILFTLDYVMGTGIFMRLYRGCRTQRSDVEYVQLMRT